MSQIKAVVLLVSVFWASAASAQFPYPDQTPLVRFTGELLPLDEQDHGELSTLSVFIQGKHWLFKLAEVQELTGRVSDRAILQDLLGRQVRFYGSTDLIVPLLNPRIMGKVLTVEGRLYPRERRFLITGFDPGKEIEHWRR